ncbi:PIR protein [Plasmodium vivax]|nr:PIR protein [Plasmodium vivax]
MFSVYHNIKHIPFTVFYDGTIAVKNRLPSEQRNTDIITGITFGEFLKYANKYDKSNIHKWLNQHENKLRKHLSTMQNKFEKQEDNKYCTNLNYILDFVAQAVDNLKDYEFVKWVHDFETKNMDTLKSYSSLKCKRDIHKSEDKNLYIKKIMYDLFEDIQYMLSNEKYPSGKPCNKMLRRIKNRWRILSDIYKAVKDKSIFNFDNSCTLDIIYEKLRGLSCNIRPALPQAVTVPEPQSINEVRDPQGDLLESRETEDGEEPLDVKNPESGDPIPDLEISLQFNEDPPKLDTTYAAASLAGISLFGTILYKYGPFRNRFNSRRGGINGSNIFPLENNVYDANTMNNFEYLQTGIPNDEYQLGYGSVTNY